MTLFLAAFLAFALAWNCSPMLREFLAHAVIAAIVWAAVFAGMLALSRCLLP